MPTVVVLGDVNVDIVARLESYPPPGGDSQPLQTMLQVGGTSLNTAIMLKRLGVDVVLIARAGADVLGDFAVAEIARNGLSTEWVQRDDRVTTGVAYAAVTPDGERTLLGGGGANRNLDAQTVPFDVIAQANWLHLTSYSVLGAASLEATLHATQLARINAAVTSLDIGLAPVRLARQSVTQLAAEMRLLMLSEQVSIDVMTDQTLLRKLGAQGCVIAEPDGHRFQVPAFAVNVVDSTGAGDAFNGGYIAGSIWQLDTCQSALLANACGAAATTVLGAGSALPTREVVKGLLRERCPTGWEKQAKRVLEVI